MSLPDLPQSLAAVLLDLDGTLVDTEPLHFESQNRVLAEQGCRMSAEEFTRHVGWAEVPFWEEVAREHGLAGSPRELAEKRTRALLALFEEREVPVLPGARELLELLAELELPCAVASSSPREQVEATLVRAGLREWVLAVRSGHDDVLRGKPAPDVYLAAAAALGVSAASCLAVEDSATGAASARAAGCFVVAVPCPSHPDARVGAVADRRLGSLEELVAILAGRPRRP